MTVRCWAALCAVLLLAACSAGTTDDVDAGALVRAIDWPLDVGGGSTWGESVWLGDTSGTADAAGQPALIVLSRDDAAPVAIDPASGALRWRGSAGSGGRLVPAPGGGVVVAGNGPEVTALDATGARRWSAEAGGDLRAMAAAPGLGLLAVATEADLEWIDDAGRVTSSRVAGVRALAAAPSATSVWGLTDSLVELTPTSAIPRSTISLDGCSDPAALGVDPSGEVAVVACAGSSQVRSIRLSDGSVRSTEATVDGPRRVVFTGGVLVQGRDGRVASYDLVGGRLAPRGTQSPGPGAGGPAGVGRRSVFAIGAPARLRTLVTVWRNGG